MALEARKHSLTSLWRSRGWPGLLAQAIPAIFPQDRSWKRKWVRMDRPAACPKLCV